jgi:hypothetical protein
MVIKVDRYYDISMPDNIPRPHSQLVRDARPMRCTPSEFRRARHDDLPFLECRVGSPWKLEGVSRREQPSFGGYSARPERRLGAPDVLEGIKLGLTPMSVYFRLPEDRDVLCR